MLLINDSDPLPNHKLKHGINACASSPVCNKILFESIIYTYLCACVFTWKICDLQTAYVAKCAGVNFN